MKRTRVAVSLLIFSLLTFYFLDFAQLLPDRFHALTHFQLVPALLAFHVGVLIILILLTYLFGRVYCSSLCPMGIFQDIVAWLAGRRHRKKKYPALRERKILRWSIVALVIVAWLAGFTIVISLLDPYSAYGRVAANILKPVYLAANNLIAYIGNHFDNYRFYKTEVFMRGVAALFTAAVTMFVVVFLSYKYGRLYCNTICPVGTVLGLLARISVFKIKINESRCNSCGLCSMKCKASCIDSPTKTIDYSRCVNCFNCLEACHRKAMSYGFSYFQKREPAPAIVEEKSKFNSSRRKLLSVSVMLGLAGVQKLFGKDPDSTMKKMEEIYTSHNVPFKKKHPVAPPGSINVKRFNDRCTACNLCVSKCPSNVLQPTFVEYGLAGMLQPAMIFEHGYCNFHCTLCTEICPSNALLLVTGKEKETLQVGEVHFVKENCVVVTDGTDCGACSEHCPTQAVSMQPYKDKLRIPVIDNDLCIGCGGCEYICPVRPFRAIYVDGKPVHGQAKVPPEKKQEKVELDDFGF